MHAVLQVICTCCRLRVVSEEDFGCYVPGPVRVLRDSSGNSSGHLQILQQNMLSAIMDCRVVG